MEPIKIQVELSVNVNLPKHLEDLIKALPASVSFTPAAQAPAAQAPAAQAPAAQAPAAQAPAAQAPTSSLSIEDVRKALSEKVNDNRPAIKAKLTELGAPSVTKLDPSKYQELYDFLIAL